MTRPLFALTTVVALLALTPPAQAQLSLEPDCLPRGAIDSYYPLNFQASGGVPPYSYAVTAGTVPPGWAFPGFPPTMTGDYAFTLTATDSNGSTVDQAYVLRIEERFNMFMGAGNGAPNPNQAAILDRSGNPVGPLWQAYGSGQWGTNVAGGNLRDDPWWELLTAPGPGDIYGPHIRGWDFQGSPIQRINFFGYGTLKFGANVAACDLDGDLLDEILIGPGPGAVFGPHVRAFNYDGGNLSSIQRINYFAYSTLKYGVNLACGDVDGDCIGEIITGAGPGQIFATTVRGWNYDATTITPINGINYNAFQPLAWGVNVATGDVDADYYDEILVGRGPDPGLSNDFAGFNFDGGPSSSLTGYQVTAFNTLYGGVPGSGEFGDPPGAIPGGWELIAAPGPDPSAPASVKLYAYSGTGLILLQPGTINVFPGLNYGVNPAGVKTGY